MQLLHSPLSKGLLLMTLLVFPVLIVSVLPAIRAAHVPSLTWTNLTNSGYDDTNPDIFADRDGRLWITWARDVAGDWNIFAMNSTDNGGTWSNPMQMTSSADPEGFPSMCQDLTGRLWIFYNRGPPGSGKQWYITSDNAGHTWSAPVQFTFESGHHIWGDSFVDSTGRIWVMYANGNPTYYRYSNDNGTTWTSPAALTSNPSKNHMPNIAEDDHDTLWVVFQSERAGTGSWDVYCKNTADGGATWSVDRALTTDHESYSPGVVQDSGGELHIMWSYQYQTVKAAASADYGATWQTPDTLPSPASAGGPKAIRDLTGVVRLVCHGQGPANYDIFFTTVNWGQVTTTTTTSTPPIPGYPLEAFVVGAALSAGLALVIRRRTRGKR